MYTIAPEIVCFEVNFHVDKNSIHCYNFYMEIFAAAFVVAPIGCMVFGIGKWLVVSFRDSL